MAHKRVTIIRLRDDQHIDESVLLQLQHRLEAEETRLNAKQAQA